MPKRLYFRAALILVFPVVFLQLIVSIVFIQRHFEGVTVQMTRTVAAELDLISEIIEQEGAVAAQKIARSLGMSMSIVAQDTQFIERRRFFDFTGLVVRRELLELPGILTVDLPDNRKVNARIQSGQEYFDLQFSRRRVSASNPHQLIVYLVVFGFFFTVIAFFYLRNQLRPITRLADAAQYAQKIENGELTDLQRDVIVMGTAPEFFNSIDACGNDFTVRPITNCGKGDPMQSMIMGNGGPTIRGTATVKSVN